LLLLTSTLLCLAVSASSRGRQTLGLKTCLSDYIPVCLCLPSNSMVTTFLTETATARVLLVTKFSAGPSKSCPFLHRTSISSAKCAHSAAQAIPSSAGIQTHDKAHVKVRNYIFSSVLSPKVPRTRPGPWGGMQRRRQHKEGSTDTSNNAF
jgi:hypothetical protein